MTKSRNRVSPWWGLWALLPLMSAQASNLEVSVELPRLPVAEYHRPYVAVWLESASNEVTHLAVWYDVDMREDKGREWLKDMRQWWRRGGRTLDLPYDGLTSATRGPGSHTLEFPLDKGALEELPPGDYRLRVEAAREVGGRELVEIPLSWPINAKRLPLDASGSEELGRVQVRLNP